MRRTVFVFVVLIAASVALEPLIHTHPLSQSVNNPCAICVTSVGRLTPLTISVASPLNLIGDVAAVVLPAPSKQANAQLSSRAPPSA